MITPDEIPEPSHAQTLETILLQRYPKLVLSIDKFLQYQEQEILQLLDFKSEKGRKNVGSIVSDLCFHCHYNFNFMIRFYIIGFTCFLFRIIQYKFIIT
jgi:hypothetical protein